VRDKKLLTQTLLAELPKHLGITAEDAYATWWANLRSSGGLRLTDRGYEIFCEHLNLEHHCYSLEQFCITMPQVLALDRKLQMPYYIVTRKKIPVELVMFGSQEAMLINLYGDLEKFLRNYN
jgi:hypothetical protein